MCGRLGRTKLVSIVSLFCMGIYLVGSGGPYAQSEADTSLYAKPADGGTRRFEVIKGRLTVQRSPTANSKILKEYGVGDVVSNLGCVDDGGERWCQIRSIYGGPIGFAKASGLAPAFGPDGVLARGKDDSKRRAKRKEFDAAASVSCAQEKGQALSSCNAGVSRSGGGDATVAVTFPNGFVRSLFFVNGTFIRASSTMSGVGTDIDWRLDKGWYFIRVDDQKFELPQAFVLGNS